MGDDWRAASNHSRQPVGPQFPAGQPGGIVEGVITGPIDCLEHQLGSPGAANGCQGAHPFQLDQHRVVGHGGSEQVHRVIQPVGPVHRDAGRRGPGPRVGGTENLLKEGLVDLAGTAPVNRLEQPQALQPQSLKAVGCRVELGQPCGHRLADGNGVMSPEHAAGHVAAIGRLSGQIIEQFRDRSPGEIDPRRERSALGGHPPDSAMLAIAAGVAKVDLAMLDDRVVPVGDIDRPIWAQLDVDRTERDPLGANQVGQLFTAEARTLLGKPEATDPVGPKVVGDQGALGIVGKMGPVHDFQATVFRAARVHTVEDARGADGRLIGGAGKAIVDALASGPIGDQ